MTAVRCKSEGGFTLVELLVVMGMFGLVMTAIYTTFIANQKTASSQGEVVEVQHNLRVALDSLSRDMKLAGVMIPVGTANPIAAASNGTSITINTASAEGRFARIESSAPYQVTGNPSSITLTLERPVSAATPNIVDGFAAGNHIRLIRPVNGQQPLTGTQSLVVSGAPGRGVFGTTSPSITLAKSDSSPFNAGDVVNSSDMLAKVTNSATFPETISYYLANSGETVGGFTCPPNQKCLVREVNGAAPQVMATNISSLSFSYLNDSYLESATPSDFSTIRAVRITLRGATARAVTVSGGAKVREVTTIVKLRNRR